MLKTDLTSLPSPQNYTTRTLKFVILQRTRHQYKLQYILFSKQMMPFVLREVLSLAFAFDGLS